MPSSKELQIVVAVRHELFCRLKGQNRVQGELIQLVDIVPRCRLCHLGVPSPEVNPQILVLRHANLQFEVEMGDRALPNVLLVDQCVSHPCHIWFGRLLALRGDRSTHRAL